MDSREQFEKWLSEWIDVPVDKIVALRSDDPDEPYFSEDHDEEALQLITIAYTAWAASRAAVEIDLPVAITQQETCKYGLEPSDAYGLSWGSSETLSQCGAAIRAAGLRVKEK